MIHEHAYAEHDDHDDLVRLHEALRTCAIDIEQSATRLQQIIDQYESAAVLIDPYAPTIIWPIVAANAAAAHLSGRPAAGLQQTPLNLVVQEPFDAPQRRILLDALQHAEFVVRECTIRRSNGSQVPIEAHFSLIGRQGTDLLLCVMRYAMTQHSTEATLRRRIAGEQCVAAISQQFVALPQHELGHGIEAALELLGDFIAADHAFLILDPPSQPDLSRVWLPSGIAPATQISTIRSAYTASWATDQLHHGTLMIDAETDPTRRQPLRAMRQSSACLVTPLLHDTTYFGMLGVESRQSERIWSDTDLTVITAVGATMARVLSHQRDLDQHNAAADRYRQLAEHATDVIASLDQHGVCLYCSPVIQAQLGYDPASLVGGRLYELVHSDDRPAVRLAFRRIVRYAEPDTITFRMSHRSGRSIWFETSFQPRINPTSGRVDEVICVGRDISERMAYQTQIEMLAFFDSLTGLANRRRLQMNAEAAIADARRQGTAVSLLYLDLDRFKDVNDTLGHDAGDDLLMQVASRLRANTRTEDTLARLGGDEFVVLLPGQNRDHATQVAQRILDQIERPFALRGRMIHLGVSIGIACFPDDGSNADALMTHADIAMYRAKEEGNTFTVFDVSLSSYAQARVEFERDLREAIEHDTLTLFYQPILELASGAIVGVEALLRWQHPARGLLLPEDFMPMAEEIGLTRTLDRWVLHAGMRQLVEWHTSGRMLSLTLNLSMPSLHDRNLLSYLASCLAETGAPAASVTIEVTERASMRDPELTAQLLGQIKQLGLRIALDDFGSGHASLNYLKDLPIDEVKIDRSFIEGLATDSRDEGVVRAILSLGHALGLMIVAEGVTTEAQREWLKAAGCHMAQGYGIGLPVAHTEM